MLLVVSSRNSLNFIMCLGWFMASAVDEVSAILGLSQGSDSVPDDLKSPEQHQVFKITQITLQFES